MTTTKSAPPPALRPTWTRPRAAIAARTLRTDRWWFAPLITVIGLTSWLAYGTVRVFMHKWYWVEQYHYLTPFYSPCVTDRCLPEASHFGQFLPGWWFIPDAALTLPLLLLFRLTCYYYRGAYYKAFWADPVNCAVGEPRKEYRGEQKLPLIVQNIHRYALYFALIFIVLLSIDAWHALWFFDPVSGAEKFGLGVGSLVMIVNVVLIGGYTLGCHSLRHLVGGVFDVLSRRPIRKKAYDCVSCLNRHHPKWAWCSLVWVAWTDIYIRLCATGVITDWRIF